MQRVDEGRGDIVGVEQRRVCERPVRLTSSIHSGSVGVRVIG